MHRLFFALFPDRAALAAIEHLRERLRADGILHGRWIAAERYHLTARFLGDHDAAAAGGIVERACAAAERVRMARIAVAFDRIDTFRGRFRSPCVLRCTRAADAAVCALWRELGRELALAGIEDSDDRRFLPHLTLAYVDRSLDVPIAVEPIAWDASDFALVDSHRSQHDVVARWPLRA